MGYALFFARKLSLTARVNQMNAQLMVISNQQNDLTNQIAAKQNAMNTRTATANLTAAKNYKSAIGDGSDSSKVTAAQSAYDEAMAQNSLLNTTDDIDIQGLQSQVDALDLRRETLETQLTAAQQELEAVEKAEESAIKAATPKYVG